MYNKQEATVVGVGCCVKQLEAFIYTQLAIWLELVFIIELGSFET